MVCCEPILLGVILHSILPQFTLIKNPQLAMIIIHGTFSRKKFFLAILMQEISRKKFNARNARKTTDKNYLYKEQIV